MCAVAHFLEKILEGISKGSQDADLTRSDTIASREVCRPLPLLSGDIQEDGHSLERKHISITLAFVLPLTNIYLEVFIRVL